MASQWKETPASMWAWLAQRLSAVFALGLVIYHYLDPANVRVQTLLVGFVVFHAALGIRVLLLDLGLKGVYHKTALAILLLTGAALVAAQVLWNR